MLVIHALDQLSVPYVIGGPLASAVHGVIRATMDTDIVAALRLEHAQPLADMLSGTFYADADMIRDAIEHHMSFNVIHLETVFKVDVFIPKEREFDRLQIRRRTPQVISTDPSKSLLLQLPRIRSWQRWSGIEWVENNLRDSGVTSWAL